MRILHFLVAVTFSTYAWSETQRDEILGVACQSLAEREGALGSTPRFPISEMRKNGQYVFLGLHHNNKATIVYRCSADTGKVKYIMLYIPVRSESQGMSLIDTELNLAMSRRFRVCHDTEGMPLTQRISGTQRIVNLRLDESVEYLLQLTAELVLEGEFQVNIRIGSPSSAGLVGEEIPKCG